MCNRAVASTSAATASRTSTGAVGLVRARSERATGGVGSAGSGSGSRGRGSGCTSNSTGEGRSGPARWTVYVPRWRAVRQAVRTGVAAGGPRLWMSVCAALRRPGVDRITLTGAPADRRPTAKSDMRSRRPTARRTSTIASSSSSAHATAATIAAATTTGSTENDVSWTAWPADPAGAGVPRIFVTACRTGCATNDAVIVANSPRCRPARRIRSSATTAPTRPRDIVCRGCPPATMSDPTATTAASPAASTVMTGECGPTSGRTGPFTSRSSRTPSRR